MVNKNSKNTKSSKKAAPAPKAKKRPAALTAADLKRITGGSLRLEGTSDTCKDSGITEYPAGCKAF
jgi:hypothetical protein